MKDAIVVGWGMVGKATAHAFGIKDYYSRSKSTVSYEKIKDFKYIFVCLPTPTVKGIQSIVAIVDLLNKTRTDENIFIIRSTVIPGTCWTLENKCNANIVHAPEFLTEKTWKDDTEHPDIVVLGGNNKAIRSKVEGIFRGRYKGAEFFITDTETSEMAKYAINCFYALKVVYANQLYDACEDIGINYENIKKIMYSRKWIGKNHLEIHHAGYRGAGGKCLKKDLEAFAHDTGSTLLIEADELNHAYLGDHE
jgi:UDPglucose 6-dehydrogenase